MVTWLTRSLIFIVGGAVLAFAVTTGTITYHSAKHGATLDVHTVGAILLLVGVFDLLLNFGVSMYLRDTGQPMDPYIANPATMAQPVYAEQPVYVQQAPVQQAPARPVHDTQPIPRAE